MKKSLFEFSGYRSYLVDRIRTEQAGRGEKSRIAKAIGCHPAYITLVLRGKADFSLEQADKICGYWNLSQQEREFFMLLVLRDRAGTASLKEFYDGQIHAQLDRRVVLKNRFNIKNTISRVDQSIYYGAWYFAAVHMLISIPRFQNVAELSRHLGISPKLVKRVLEFLVNTGLATQDGNNFRSGTVNIHLGADTEMIAKHHSNWRLQCLRSLELEHAERDMHYSSVVTISSKDVPKIREMLVKAIEEVRIVVRDSPEEDLYCYNLDLFKVGI